MRVSNGSRAAPTFCTSIRAEAWAPLVVISTTIGLSTVGKNPALGPYHLLSTPTVALPSCYGIQREPDTRFREVVDAWIYLLGLVWCCVFLLFPLFNRDRMRIGDIVAGTWVVRAPKRMLAADLAGASELASFVFTQAQVDAYGIKELSVLETVLRDGNPETIEAVAARIRAKIGVRDGLRDQEFLAVYYRALRARLETRMLFGRRKRDKFDVT